MGVLLHLINTKSTIMATKTAYNQCVDFLSKHSMRTISTKRKSKRIRKPDLSFFGIVELIDECELIHCSKSEQRRHLREDDLLLAYYTE